MRLIIGGRAQGKLEYVRHFFSEVGPTVAEDFTAAESSQVFYHFEQAVRCALAHGEDPAQKLRILLEKNPSIMIICDEIGCGVVPIQREERQWRETVGRLCCWLAERAESVERIFCGLPMRLK